MSETRTLVSESDCCNKEIPKSAFMSGTGQLHRKEETCDRPVGYGCAAESPRLDDVKREIRITPLNYGYIVKIDCHQFAIETKESLIKKLTDYITNPSGVEAEWFKNQTL
jgi:hypothetical protein